MEGSNTGEAFLTTEGCEEHQSLDSLPQLGSALAAARLESSSKVRRGFQSGTYRVIFLTGPPPKNHKF